MDDSQQAKRAELEQIRRENGGLLRAEDVVAFARNERTALHAEFTWDDTEAAHQYRIVQAQRVIRVIVDVVPSPYSGVGPVRAYVSVPSDRMMPGGGYRSVHDVLTNDDLRQQLVNEALAEAKRWRKRHEQLKELSAIFKAIDKVEAKMEVVTT